MKALYALPDHEVVMELIPRIADTHLSADAAVERIRAVNGLVPVAIDPADGGKVLWADIGDHLFPAPRLKPGRRLGNQLRGLGHRPHSPA